MGDRPPVRELNPLKISVSLEHGLLFRFNNSAQMLAFGATEEANQPRNIVALEEQFGVG